MCRASGSVGLAGLVFVVVAAPWLGGLVVAGVDGVWLASTVEDLRLVAAGVTPVVWVQ